MENVFLDNSFLENGASSEVVTLTTSTSAVKVINNSVVWILPRTGETVDGESMAEITQKVHSLVHGDYGYIIDHQTDYAIEPVPLFMFLNNCEKLRAIANVCHRDISRAIVEIEISLSAKPLKIFDSVEYAVDWIDNVLAQ